MIIDNNHKINASQLPDWFCKNNKTYY